MEHTTEHSERFDLRAAAGRLIDSEHRARYLYASSMVPGKKVLDAGCGLGYGIEVLSTAGAKGVTGVDIDPDAVGEAASRVEQHADAVRQADIRDLPFDSGEFDVVVCFETIEHVESGDRALAELSRVLKPDGVLIVSTPNPDVYHGGNEHHVHEYRPQELAAAVSEHFSHVHSYGQRACLASIIEKAADGGQEAIDGSDAFTVIQRTSSHHSGDETYSIVVASNEKLPSMGDVMTFGSAFEVRWWSDQLAASQNQAARALDGEQTVRAQLRETSTALLDANQELAQIPVLHHRMAELREEYKHLQDAYGLIVNSRSWRLTSLIRSLWARVRRG